MGEREGGKKCLVVGAGALGLLLAKALMASRLSSELNEVALFNKSPVSGRFVFVDSTGHELNFSLPLYSNSVRECFESFQPASLFFCVPPEAIEQVFASWMDAFEAQSAPPSPIEVVFCNNGCLPPRVLQRILSLTHRVHCVRALFFVGAMRSVQTEGLRVHWTGGHSVLWGRIPSGTDSLREPRWLAKGESTEERPLDFLRWHREKDILSVERRKFFTNFMLAAGLGPRLAKNKTLPEHLPEAMLSRQAEQFAVLWQSFNLSSEALKETLHMTLKATGENINSLSLAGARGNTATMLWFVESLRSEIAASSEKENLISLSGFLDSVQSVWGKNHEH
ncbi:MAG: hypothetical protein RIR26_310 [Pseudomonadota bacterium]